MPDRDDPARPTVKILFAPKQPAPVLDIARALAPPGYELVVADVGTPEFIEAAADAEFYLGLARRMGGEFFRSAPKLRLVQLLSAGYDHVDVEAARKAGVPVSNNGGRQPLWRDDGKELYFVSDDRKFYAVAVSESSGSLVLGIPEFLFDMRANVSYARNSYIPSPDGKRFLVNMLLDAEDAPINVVYNWRTTLK